MAIDEPAARRRRILCWSLAALLGLVPALMLVLVYALGPYGTCEAELNDQAMVVVWLVATGVGALVAYALVLVVGRRHLLALPASLGAAAAVFALGLIPWITYTTCVD